MEENMKLYVNEEACIGCGACVAIDSEHFDFNEDNLSEVISQEDIEGETTKNAIASCPTNAISYMVDAEEDNFTESCEHCNGSCNHEKDNCGGVNDTCNHDCENK